MVKKRMIHLSLLNASKDAIEYATDIDVGKFTDVFNTEETFQKKWNDTISLYGGIKTVKTLVKARTHKVYDGPITTT